MKETMKWNGQEMTVQTATPADGYTTLEDCSHGSHKGHSGLNTISNSSGNERSILDGFENCIGR